MLIVKENSVVMAVSSQRPRRLRNTQAMRDLVAQTQLNVKDFVLPLFIKAGSSIKHPISTMPGQFQFSVDQLETEITEIVSLGIPAVLLFGIPEYKDATGSAAWQANGVVQQAVRHIKTSAPDLLVMADLCCCEYTDHGHCGVVEKNRQDQWYVHNDKTLPLLAKQALSLAQAGADIIAPSGMMDGMVAVIRQTLDAHGFTDVIVLSYAVKYASSFYGPFREAAQGAPQFGDRKAYQMDCRNAQEALREAELDVVQGADMLMVKPAQNYLDIVYRVKQAFPALPLGAYQVSGEFAMIKAAAEKNLLDEKQAMLESLMAIKRAGADFIITYFAKAAAIALTQI